MLPLFMGLWRNQAALKVGRDWDGMPLLLFVSLPAKCKFAKFC